MSLYKTQRCRHFDEGGNPIKPYCTQGNKCRFIHPNDHQWAKLKRRNDDSPSPEYRETVRPKGRHKSPSTPPHRQHSSPLIPQTDLFKRKQKDISREHDHRDWYEDRRRNSGSWGYTRERHGPVEQGYSLKRANDEGDQYPNRRPRLSDSTSHGPTSGSDARHAPPTDKDDSKLTCQVSHVPAQVPKTTKVSDTFHRLAKLCCEIVQDTCFLDRDEDKLKAFTGLSSELSRAVPDAAMAVTPTLATVLDGHTRTRERLENNMEELETVWKTLFAMLEGDISKAINSRLEQAMTLLGNERDNALRMITHSQRPSGDRLHDGRNGHRQSSDSRRETVTDRTTLSERSTMSVNGGPIVNAPPEETYHRKGSTSLLVVPTLTQEPDLGTSLKIVLEDMKMQMDRQTRAIESLAKENLQLRSATECLPSQVSPFDSASMSPRKPGQLML